MMVKEEKKNLTAVIEAVLQMSQGVDRSVMLAAIDML